MGRRINIINSIFYFVILLFSVFLINCFRKDDGEQLKNAWLNNDYAKYLKLLRRGSIGDIEIKKDVSILYDIYTEYRKKERTKEIEEIFDFYLRNRKDFFQKRIERVWREQTVGSYIAHTCDLETLTKLVEEKININSPYEISENTAIFDLASMMKDTIIHNDILGKIYIEEREKKERLSLLIEADVDVSLKTTYYHDTIFHQFKWWPAEDNFTEILDKMIEKGADIHGVNYRSHSPIYSTVGPYALDHHAELYLKYLLGKGVRVTQDDLGVFYRHWYKFIYDEDNDNTGSLKRIEILLKDALKRQNLDYIP